MPAVGRLERDAAAAPWLHRVQTPAKRRLLREHDGRGVRDRLAAQDRLTGDGCTRAARFSDLLILARAHPVHAEQPTQIAGYVAVAAPPAIAIDFLEQDDVGLQRPQRGDDLLKLDAALDVPADDGERTAAAHAGGRHTGRLPGNGVDLGVGEPRLVEITRKSEDRQGRHDYQRACFDHCLLSAVMRR